MKKESREKTQKEKNMKEITDAVFGKTTIEW